MQSPWAVDSQKVLQDLQSGSLGLSSDAAAARLTEFGPNELKAKHKRSTLQKFASQFSSFPVLLLIIAAAISLVINQGIEAAFILVVIVLNAVFGFTQENQAENTLDELKKLAAPQAKVIRNGKSAKIDSRSLVPGDVIELEEGDRVPADCRLIESHSFETLESALTGESTPVAKDAAVVLGANTGIGDQVNMAFSGTTVARGRALGVVTGTGSSTEFGKIATLVSGVTEEATPLEEKITKLGRDLAMAAVAICAVIFTLGIVLGREPAGMFLIAISLLVAAVPEGLPIVVTITLALGVLRMAKKNAIVRRLSAVETLGSTTLICSDKTGTLTTNQMAARVVSTFERDYAVVDIQEKKPGLQKIIEVSALCNNARLIREDDKLIHVGDPTEVALLELAKKAGVSKEDLETEFEFVSEHAFDSNRKMMSVIYRDKKKRKIAFVKGAPEQVISQSKFVATEKGEKLLTKTLADRLRDKNDELSSQALRVVALAYKPISGTERLKEEHVEKELIFVGLVGIIDPPRPEAKSAVALCREAGVKVAMITGDNEKTAVAIANELGILDGGKVLTGKEIDGLSEDELTRLVTNVRVFARVSPQHKLRIVNAFQRNGEIVAMTGDGVNDAPALKKADIGITMGRTGTEVARESSKMVLMDDNFAAIVAAVEEGRKIYDNIAKSVKYLIAGNIGAIFTVFVPTVLPSVFNNLIPLTAVQIIWMNLVNDSAPALALGSDNGDPQAMKRPPRNPNEEVIHAGNVGRLIAVGLLVGSATLAIFLYALQWGTAVATTMAFSVIIITRLLYALSSRSKYTPFYKLDKNKVLFLTIALGIAVQFAVVQVDIANQFLETTPLGIAQWGIIIFAALSVVAIVEVYKIVSYKTRA